MMQTFEVSIMFNGDIALPGRKVSARTMMTKIGASICAAPSVGEKHDTVGAISYSHYVSLN